MKITLFGCDASRFNSLHDYYEFTSIHKKCNQPSSTEEILQQIDCIKGNIELRPDERRWLFSSGILERSAINPQTFRNELEITDIFLVELSSPKTYTWFNKYVNRIAKEPLYGFPFIDDLDESDAELESGILRIKYALSPKQVLFIGNLSKDQELNTTVENICKKYSIPFFNPLKQLETITEYTLDELVADTNYTVLGHSVIGRLLREFIENTRVVIFSWPQKAVNRDTTNFWGLGDMIRGIITLYEMSKSQKFKLIVDFSHHPISKYIERSNHAYKDFVDSMKDNIQFVSGDDLNMYILSHNPAILCTNGKMNVYDTAISEDCRSFVLNSLRPSHVFLQYQLDKRLFSHFTAYHFRLGDDFLVHGKESENFVIPYEILKSQLEKESNGEKIVLFSDSVKFKKYVFDSKLGIDMYQENVVHLGCMTDDHGTAATLFEFLTLCNARKIKTFSSYPWISGFVKSAAALSNIELINLL